MDMTISWYDENADQYACRTVTADVSALRLWFSSRLSPGARILDAGCGSGRDIKAFADDGFDVSAFDGSISMVFKAAAHAGRKVAYQNFERIASDISVLRGPFDGIWCCASLLHLPKNSMPSVLSALKDRLSDNGLMFMSVKEGDGEASIAGRRFSFYRRHELIDMVATAGLDMVDISSNESPFEHGTRWINILSSRPSTMRPCSIAA
jgi:2-polyprenyl-3-methyl-5-hydroxy-6-metoxy-1,4-benzoquinol methylase